MKQRMEIVKQCRLCKEEKYDRHPPNPEISKTPIAEYAGHFNLIINQLSTQPITRGSTFHLRE